MTSTERIGALMITCEELDAGMLEVLTQAVEALHLKTDAVCFQSHRESFYYYNLYQPENLWKQGSVLCEYRDSSIQTYYMECNRHTMPVVTYIEEREFPFPVENRMKIPGDRHTAMREPDGVLGISDRGRVFSRMDERIATLSVPWTESLSGEQPVQQGCLLQHDGATASQ